MGSGSRRWFMRALALAAVSSAFAQDPHAGHDMAAALRWTFMQDGDRLRDVQRPGQSARRARGQSAELVDGHGARSASASGQLTLNLMLSLDPATVGNAGLQPHLPDRRVVRGNRAHRSSASARFPDAGRGRLAAAARDRADADAGGRAGRRAGARPDRVHAPLVGGREPDVAARPSHVRLVAHRDGRAHRVARTRPVPGRSRPSSTAPSPTRTGGI